MKYPEILRNSNYYYEKYILHCEDSPHAYVSAFREAQYESRHKRQNAWRLFWLLTAVALTAWMAGYVHMLVAIAISAVFWTLVNWHNRHEMQLISRTFQMALKNKDRAFQSYMWKHLDRSLLGYRT